MPKLEYKKGDAIEYKDALSTKEIEEADAFLKHLKKVMFDFEATLSLSLKPSSIEYRYKIGEFLNAQLSENNISPKERQYVWQEIKTLVNSNVVTSEDRGKNREFYEYCYLIYNFGYETAKCFTWSQWVDILDRSAATKDCRFIYWLKIKSQSISTNNLRMILLILNSYLEYYDTSVFNDDEVQKKYDFLYKIVEEWNRLLHIYFDKNDKRLSRARSRNLTKYKRKYVNDVLMDSKFAKIDDLSVICERAFKKNFVDIDTSYRFKK